MARLLLPLTLAMLPGPPAAPPGTPLPPAPDVRIVFWFDRARPLDTFRYQAYDLARREYTPAVDAWLARLRKEYPGYAAYARDVDASRGQGDTRDHRIGHAILQEFLGVGLQHGYDFGGYLPGIGPSAPLFPSYRPSPALRPTPGRPGLPAGVSPAPTPFPVPFPFPRPHP